MTDSRNPFRQLHLGFNPRCFSEGLFLCRAFEAGFTSFQNDHWRIGEVELRSAVGDVVAAERSPDSEAVIFEAAGCLSRVVATSGFLDVLVAGPDPAAAAAQVERLRLQFPPLVKLPSDDLVSVRFTWSSRDGGWTFAARNLQVPLWADIAANYAGSTSAGLANLMGIERPPETGGRTVLWHGPPGTGKTFALRALARAWRDWCDLRVIADPEALLGGRPDYLLELLTGGKRKEDDRWQLLVLEDTGELLVADARERAGQGLSRFLNVADGLLGQGLRTLILVSTNEDLSRIHTAVSRPGRCLAQVEFGPLSVAEANDWLAGRCAHRVSAPTALADLFALAAGREHDEPARVGFQLPGQEAA